MNTKKSLVIVLFISLLLTSCTKKVDDIEPIIKEKEQLEFSLELANKHIDKLEKELNKLDIDTKKDENPEEKRSLQNKI